MVNALSRRESGEDEDVHYQIVHIIEPTWLKEVQELVKSSQFYREIEAQIQKKGDVKGIQAFQWGLVLLWACTARPSPLCSKLVQNNHHAPEGGHSRYHQTLQRVKKTFWWSG